MIDPETLEIIQTGDGCDECGQEFDFCECIVCSECQEFGPGALTKDQDLALCEECAYVLDVEMFSFTHARMQAEQAEVDRLTAHRKEQDDE